MKTALKKASNSVIYDRIKTIRISAGARSQALRRLQWAEQATATILREFSKESTIRVCTISGARSVHAVFE